VWLATLPGREARAQVPVLDEDDARLDYDAPLEGRDGFDVARAAVHAMFWNYAIWQFDWFTERDYIAVTRSSLSENLRRGFEWDIDPLQTNFFGHPVHGSLYFASARAAGLSFWESIPYSVGGSLVWELFAETELPSMNDFAATSLGGIFVGEVLQRLSSQVLDDSTKGGERLMRELLAAVVDPPRGIDRLTTGRAWASGPAPIRRPTRVGIDIGVDRLGLVQALEDDKGRTNLAPSLLLALQINYGDLLPRTKHLTLGPLEYFDIYAAANLLDTNVTGVQMFGTGLLYGFSTAFDRNDARPDNAVFGLFQSFDYQGANIARFGAIGLGPGIVHSTRGANGRGLRIGTSAEWVPVLGITSPHTGTSPRDYNIATGGSLGVHALADLGRIGRLGLRAKSFLGPVVDGEEGTEYAGYARAWYEVDVVPGVLAVGAAPTALVRYSQYASGERFRGAQLDTQLYVVIHADK
jgi:hypothetical protein